MKRGKLVKGVNMTKVRRAKRGTRPVHLGKRIAVTDVHAHYTKIDIYKRTTSHADIPCKQGSPDIVASGECILRSLPGGAAYDKNNLHK